jgi:short-subunit dehydrogenase
MSYLKGKVVWITGASSGIGEALAYEIVRKGARLIISARRKEELERVKGQCHSISGSTVEILPLDLSQATSLPLIAEAAIQIYGQIDILVNNGGISQRGLAKDTTLEVDRKIMEIDYFGTITLTKQLIAHFIKRGTGHYVTVTSVVGIVGTPYRSGYSAAKHALHGFFDSLRAELWKESQRIYVTLILPGWTNTNLSLTALMGDGSAQNKKDETHEQGLTPAQVARKIVYAIENKKNEVYIGGLKETMAIYVKRFFPSLFARIVRNAKVK